ncbi:unnamed protein product [Rhodiola kirilowii]
MRMLPLIFPQHASIKLLQCSSPLYLFGFYKTGLACINTPHSLTSIFTFLMAEAPVMLAQTQAIPHLLSIVQVTLNGLRNTVTSLPITNLTSPLFTVTTFFPLSRALAQVNIGTRPVGLGVIDSTRSVNITLSPTLLLKMLPTLVNNLLNNGTIRILIPVGSCYCYIAYSFD